jgi:hypothetical protein
MTETAEPPKVIATQLRPLPTNRVEPRYVYAFRRWLRDDVDPQGTQTGVVLITRSTPASPRELVDELARMYPIYWRQFVYVDPEGLHLLALDTYDALVEGAYTGQPTSDGSMATMWADWWDGERCRCLGPFELMHSDRYKR